jgi:hypothetical protein
LVAEKQVIKSKHSCGYPIDVFHLSFNFLCLLLL